MGRYLLRRAAIAIPVLLGVSVIAFALVRLVPGDTATVMLGMRYTAERAEALRATLGLDQPLPMQYLRWLGQVVTGDLGISGFTGQPVAEALRERLPVTLQLAGASVLLALLVALPLGILAAARRGKIADHFAGIAGLIGLSVPNFWLGTLLILFVSLRLGWVPSGGYVPLGDGPVEHLRHMALPVLALGAAVAAVLLRMVRSAMLDVLDQEYMRMARAKGCGPIRVLWKHGLRNALVPVITVLGMQLGYLIGGSVVIESVFGIPGLGLLALQAINHRDYALLQGVILFIGAAFILINLIVDVIYAIANPQIRY